MKRNYKIFILIIEIYLFMTIILFIFGPIKWTINNLGQLTLFITISYLSIAFGYIYQYRQLASKKERLSLAKSNSSNINVVASIEKEMKIIFYISSFFAIVSSLIMNFEIHGAINIKGLFESGLGQLYFNALDNMNLRVKSSLIQVITLTKGLTYFYLPIGIFNWSKLSKGMKLTVFLATAFDVFYWLALGTFKGIGDTVICLVSFLLILIVFKEEGGYISRLKFNKKIILRILVLFLIMISFFILFSKGQADRFESRNLKADIFQLNYVLGRFAELNENNLFLKIKPDWIGLGSVLLTFYMSHGYYGLALCLQSPFSWTYGLGFSKAAMDYLAQYAAIDLWSRHYLFINEALNGWPSGMFWSTAFPWFASDVTFFGIPIIMFILGRIIIKILWDILNTKNPYAFAVFWQIMVLIIYLPANNQIFQSRQAFWGTIFVLLIYKINDLRKKKKYKY